MSKIFVALPIFNYQDLKVRKNFEAMIENTAHTIIYQEMVGLNTEKARARMIEQFLQTDCQFFLNLDADILYLGDIDPFDRLISLNKDIVGGIYYFKAPPCRPVYRPIDLQDIYEQTGKFPDNYKFIIPEKEFEVRYMGNGFKLVKRNVIEDIKKDIIVPNMCMIHKGEYLSEDWAFDQRAREKGYQVWADPTIKLGHLGKHIYVKEDFERYNM